MEETQSYPKLLSEKQAASRLGIARITLLRAREAGRIRFFRIGTRILYSEAQLIEFLNACERNGSGDGDSSPDPEVTRRKDNRVSRSRRSILSHKKTERSSVEEELENQASLPFSAVR